MNKLIIGIIIVILIIIGAMLFANKNDTASVKNSSNSMQGMDTSMPGMDHGSMNINQ